MENHILSGIIIVLVIIIGGATVYKKYKSCNSDGKIDAREKDDLIDLIRDQALVAVTKAIQLKEFSNDATVKAGASLVLFHDLDKIIDGVDVLKPGEKELLKANKEFIITTITNMIENKKEEKPKEKEENKVEQKEEKVEKK